jgi:succinoglycan biosynthesis transport protein ExoP
VSEARAISTATPSATMYRPKRLIFAAAGAALGLIGSLGAGLAMELAQRRIRTRAEAEAASGVECLGYIPLLLSGKDVPRLRRGEHHGRVMPLNYVVSNPFTVAAETLRAVKISLDHRFIENGCPVLGIISCVPDEGKTSISGNLAYLFAQNKRRVLLIDGDFRNPSLSNALSLPDGVTLPHENIVISPEISIIRRSDLPFHFIPAVTSNRPGFKDFNRAAAVGDNLPAVGLESNYFQKLIEALRAHYDYIIVDLPPIVPLADVRAVSRSITSFALVMAWGQSQSNVVSDALETIPGVSDKLIGSVLNRTDVKSLSRYGEHVGTYYNSKYFSE